MKSFMTTFTDVGGAFVGGGAFIGGGTFTGGGILTMGGAFVGGGGGGGTYFSLGSGGVNLGGAAGGGLHSGSGRFAQGFSSESLGEKVKLSSSPLIRSFAFFFGSTCSLMLFSVLMVGIGGGAGRCCRRISCIFFFKLFSTILAIFPSSAFSHSAFSGRSGSSRTRFA